MSEIINTKWLFENLNDKNLVIFDCSWFLPSENKKTEIDYRKKHIPGSYFFNIEKISDQKSLFPHMIPKIELFKKKIKYFNIHKKTKIIVYGSESILGSARVWWMFKYFGFNNIYVLNGGLNKWIKEKKPTTNSKSQKILSTYNFKIDETWLVNKKKVLLNLNNTKYLIFDARNKKRFNGKEEEPRKGLRNGHIPNSKNIFWKSFTHKGESILSKKLIKNNFNKYNIKNKNIILTCGSGISACVLSLSLMHATGIKGSVYDGSWAEWGSLKIIQEEI